MKERETEEDVDINIEIPPYILKNVLDNSHNSCKRKADGSLNYRYCEVQKIYSEDPRDVEGDRQAKLEEYSD
jgi:hypothetical protein